MKDPFDIDDKEDGCDDDQPTRDDLAYIATNATNYPETQLSAPEQKEALGIIFQFVVERFIFTIVHDFDHTGEPMYSGYQQEDHGPSVEAELHDECHHGDYEHVAGWVQAEVGRMVLRQIFQAHPKLK